VSREIKFRGKQISNGEWVCGYFTKNEKSGKFYITTQGEVGGAHPHQVDPETVGQFTEKTDVTGQKVYEGDIFSDHFSSKVRGIVKFGEYRNPFNDDEHGGHVGFYIDWKGDRGLNRKDLAYWIKVSRVIGNVHDNNELLEGMTCTKNPRE